MEQIFSAALQQRDGASVIVLAGEIDHDNRLLLDGILARLPGRPGPVRVDMREVPFMDSAGVHFLVELRRLALNRGDRAPTLLAVQPQPASVLGLMGLLTHFDVVSPAS